MTEFKFVREISYDEYFTVHADTEAQALKLLEDADGEPDTELVKYKTGESDSIYGDFEKESSELPFGFKLVDVGQENGVIPEIADLILDGDSTIQRMTIARPYETWFKKTAMELADTISTWVLEAQKPTNGGLVPISPEMLKAFDSYVRATGFTYLAGVVSENSEKESVIRNLLIPKKEEEEVEDLDIKTLFKWFFGKSKTSDSLKNSIGDIAKALTSIDATLKTRSFK